MADFGMAAFSVFFMQSPSFLAHQRRLAEGPGCGRSNCETLFEIIPSDNHVRAMLDPVAPDCFFPVFDVALEALEQSNGLSDCTFLTGDGFFPWAIFRQQRQFIVGMRSIYSILICRTYCVGMI
jgi:hypothetical protein